MILVSPLMPTADILSLAYRWLASTNDDRGHSGLLSTWGDGLRARCMTTAFG